MPLADRVGASWLSPASWPDGGSVADGRCQAGRGMARSTCHGATDWVSQGQTLWQMQGEAACRAGEPVRPRRRTAAGGSWWSCCSPRPIRAVQRAQDRRRHHLYRQPSAVGGEAAGRHVVSESTPYLRSRMAFSISAWRRWSASLVRASPKAASRIGGSRDSCRSVERASWPTGRGFTRRTKPTGAASGSLWTGGVGGFGHIGGAE